MNKTIKNKKGESLANGLFIISLAMLISLFAFVSEQNKITGFAALENKQEENKIPMPDLIAFKDVNSLSALSAGNYYIDGYGLVYWTDDSSRPAIAKINNIDESHKNRQIYIDDEGRIGYVLSPIAIDENK